MVLARGASLLAIAGGCLVLVGWLIPSTQVLGLGWVASVEPNAGLAMLLAGVALWGRTAPRGSGWKITAQICSVLLAVLGAATLFEHVMGRDLGIDQLAVPADYVIAGAGQRMGLTSTFIVLSFGTSLSLMPWPAGNQIAQFLTLGGLTISILSALRALPGFGDYPLLASFAPIQSPVGPALILYGMGLFCEHQRRILGWIEEDRRRIRTEIEKMAADDLARLSAQFKAEFLMNMSHEFRTPMNGILGMMDALLGTSLQRDQKDFVQTARFSADNLLGTLQNIMSYWEGQSGALTFEAADMDLQEVVASAVKAVAPRAQRKGLQLAYFISEETPILLRGDRALIHGVLIHLLANAVKFTDKGEVVVNVSKVSEKAGTCQVIFSVSDSGMGVSPEVESKLFQPFAQAQSPTLRTHAGLGLGLVIAKRMVELMGGSIGHQSSAGQGATFWFSVNIEKSADAKKSAGDLDKRRVLIVGDVVEGQDLLKLQLAAWRMAPESAATTAEAFGALNDGLNRGRKFSVVFFNDRIPADQRQALARKVRAYPFLAKTRILLLRSPGAAETPSEELKDIDAVLNTPIMAHQLEDKLRAMLAVVKKPVALSPEVLTRARILVAEDDKVNQKVAMLMLKKLGLTADLAENGVLAVKKFKENRYDLLLMDCNMPEMDGYEATKMIRQVEGRSRRTPIIALTANTLKGDRKKCLDAGMDAYLSKPISAPDLNAALLQWLKVDLSRAPSAPLPPAAPGAFVASAPIAPEDDLPAATGEMPPPDEDDVGIAEDLDLLLRDVLSLKKPGRPEPSAPSFSPAVMTPPPHPVAPPPAPAPVPAAASAAPLAAGEVLDPAAIQSLRELGGDDFVGEAIKTYLTEEAPQLVKSLGEAVKGRQADATRRAAHTLKGASAAVGAKRLTAVCKTLEEQAAESRLEQADALHGEILAEYERACAALRGYLS